MSKLKHITGVKNLTRTQIEFILELAEKLEPIYRGELDLEPLRKKTLATFFYEPSTRTRLSFESAILGLGGNYISMADAQKHSSVWKGETVADTIRTIENYADVIALRHFQAGTAEAAAAVSSKPIINSGDGPNEHPTQTLLDLLTIKKERGTLDGLKVTMVGDLKHTRSTNSLTLGLSNFDVEFTFVSPAGFKTSDWILDIVRQRGRKFTQTEELPSAVVDADVLYVCRIQKERLENPDDYKKIEGVYCVNRAMLEKAKKIVTVMHHLPRVNELAEDVDTYPGAAYFRQTYNGMLIRGALMTMLLDKIPHEFGMNPDF